MEIMRRFVLLALVVAVSQVLSFAQPRHARNVIILLADAGGIPTLNAASIYGYNGPQRLFVQSWKHVGLSDTSPAGAWVTDSAAGMSAIVTGQKTRNGVISEGPDAIRGKQEGTPYKTILEYAEEHGLATGAVTNVAITDATPAACYAHVNDRGRWGDIFLQIFSPRFGDGIDVAFGAGRDRIYKLVRESGKDLDAIAKEHERPIYASLDEVPQNATRALVVSNAEMDVAAAAKKAIATLSKNSKGYFLMVEWDAHTDRPDAGLAHVVAFDKLAREISSLAGPDTLLLFTADHSFDFRLRGGNPEAPLLSGLEAWRQQQQAGAKEKDIVLPYLRIGNSHTGEEVAAMAQGPGAELVNGFFPNTHLFEVMMNAYGWRTATAPALVTGQ